MNKRVDYVRKQWSATRRFAIAFPFFIIAIFGFNVWQNSEEGKPFDWTLLWGGMAMIAGGGLVYLFCALVFRIVLAKINHDERRS